MCPPISQPVQIKINKLDLIKEIDGRKETLKLAVRITDLWCVQNRGTRSLEMIIMDSKDATIVTIGTIGNFVVGKSGWYYLSCSNCFRKSESNIAYRCSCGTYNENPIPRYKLEAKVYQGKDSANFIFWDRDCTRLIGKSALKLRDLMIEPASQTDNETLDFNEVIQLGISFSITADHDPDESNTLTPSKRLSLETHFDDELLSQELAVAQLSSTKMTNKMTKQIKTE
ncbi:hypothetical protein Fmac_031087 [Flemingia macrophylla]|uniref:Replication factor A C-terminal domain-containing protein n=1 Tax=Flemingia macrophylla TaxID=520843 RepID=A0ABD1L120_9FABA